MSWRFVNATAKYNPDGTTTIIAWIQNTGTVSFGPAGTNPSKTPTAVPNGTAYVSGTWIVYFYSSTGTLLCHSPCSGPPNTANGGWLKVSILVTGALTGNHLVLTYTITWLGATYGPQSILFTVTAS